LMKIPVLKTVQGVVVNKIFEGCLRWQVVPQMFKEMFGMKRHRDSS